MTEKTRPTRILIGGGAAALLSAAILDESCGGLVQALGEFRPIFPSILELLLGVTSLVAAALTFAAAIGMVAGRFWPVRVIQPATLLGVISGMLALMHALAFGGRPLVGVCFLSPIAPLGMWFGLGRPTAPSRLNRLRSRFPGGVDDEARS
jgi:hypothetical protein